MSQGCTVFANRRKEARTPGASMVDLRMATQSPLLMPGKKYARASASATCTCVDAGRFACKEARLSRCCTHPLHQHVHDAERFRSKGAGALVASGSFAVRNLQQQSKRVAEERRVLLQSQQRHAVASRERA